MIVTGWGRVTNNKIAALTNLNKFSASTRTLRKLTVQHANNKCSNQDVFNIDKRLQMCAGGRIGEFESRVRHTSAFHQQVKSSKGFIIQCDS